MYFASTLKILEIYWISNTFNSSPLNLSLNNGALKWFCTLDNRLTSKKDFYSCYFFNRLDFYSSKETLNKVLKLEKWHPFKIPPWYNKSDNVTARWFYHLSFILVPMLRLCIEKIPFSLGDTLIEGTNKMGNRETKNENNTTDTVCIKPF